MILLDLVQLIETASLGTAATDLFADRLPEQPDVACAIAVYGGRPREATHDGNLRRFPRVQVVCRHPDPLVAFSRADAIWRLFDSTKSMSNAALLINGTQYEVIVPLGDLVRLTHDSHARAIFSCNYEVRYGS